MSVVLLQNYPNPFHSTTTIRFSLPEAAAVRLDVFDQMGRRVQTLFDGHLSSGWHRFEFDGLNYSSGTYIYHLRVDNESQDKLMQLIK